MSKRLFTKEEVRILSENKYIKIISTEELNILMNLRTPLL